MRLFYRLLTILAATGLLAAALSVPVNAGDIPESTILSGVWGHSQTYNLSCESRSAADWAGYFGVYISETEFLDRLPRSDNPDTGFVGSPHGVWGNIPPASYGVHAGPVAEVLRQYGLPARARSGLTWDDLRAEIAAGRPAIVWIIGAMWYGSPVDYYAESGAVVTVARYEHTMILYGYDAWYVYVIDSYSGAQQIYSISSFLNSWAVLENTAVIAVEEQPEPQDSPTPISTPAAALKFHLWFPMTWGQPKPAVEETIPSENSAPATYTVRQGDFLMQIARTYDIDWEQLAELNDIPYPYVVYPGQVLILR